MSVAGEKVIRRKSKPREIKKPLRSKVLPASKHSQEQTWLGSSHQPSGWRSQRSVSPLFSWGSAWREGWMRRPSVTSHIHLYGGSKGCHGSNQQDQELVQEEEKCENWPLAVIPGSFKMENAVTYTDIGGVGAPNSFVWRRQQKV